MVMLHMKRSEEHQFLYNTKVDNKIEDIIRELVDVQNLRTRITRLNLEGEELWKYGPSKKPDEQGIDKYSENEIEKNQFYEMDPTGRRTGNKCDPALAKKLEEALQDARKAVHKSQAINKIPLTISDLEEKIDIIRGAVMICYPMGLPEWDPVRQALEGNEDLAGTSLGNDDFEFENTQLWFAGKQLLTGKKLKDHIGNNDKTKIVVKLAKKGAGAPARESPIDEETHKAMLAWYHKKQQIKENLEKDTDDSYTNSSWANSNSLKQHFSGVHNVRIPR